MSSNNDTCFIFTDAQRFIQPQFGTEENVYAPLSSRIVLKFTYNVPDINQIRNLACGFEGGTNLVSKRRTRPAVVLTSRAKIEKDITGSSLTFSLIHMEGSRRPVQCLLVYS